MTLRVIKPRGRFHAVETRDASAMGRDGEVFFDANQLDAAGLLWEVMFEDEEWIVAAPADLEWFLTNAEGTGEGIGQAHSAPAAGLPAVPTDSATAGSQQGLSASLATPAEVAAQRVRALIAQLLAGVLPAPEAAVIDGWAEALESIALTVVDDWTLTAQMPAEHRERFGYECGNLLRGVPGTVDKLGPGRYLLTVASTWRRWLN